jgi:hypothetical protein
LFPATRFGNARLEREARPRLPRLREGPTIERSSSLGRCDASLDRRQPKRPAWPGRAARPAVDPGFRLDGAGYDADEDSDIDLLVDAPAGVSGFVLGALPMDAQELLARRVDVVTEAALHSLIRERVLCEARLL